MASQVQRSGGSLLLVDGLLPTGAAAGAAARASVVPRVDAVPPVDDVLARRVPWRASLGAHRLARVFEAAVTADSGRHLVVLWRLYARFELLRGRPEHSKRVFFRAIRSK